MCLSLLFIVSCIDELVTSVNITSSLEDSHFEYCSLTLASVNDTAQLAIFTHGDDKILILLQ